MDKIIAILSRSKSSKNIEDKLIKSGVSYSVMLVDSDFDEPKLIGGDSIFSHIGEVDIEAYLDTLPKGK